MDTSTPTMYKHTNSDTAFYNRTSKLRGPAYNYDVYYYRGLPAKSGPKKEFAFATIDKTYYYIADSTFLLHSTKKIDEVLNIEGIGYDTSDTKRYPFKKVFIVEFLAENKYKVIQVNTFIGTEFY
ncbi:hypothetical protein [Daejeonella sp.]|uniref:hypothetical protein n=1 Tax=Daejeonella sp. TaxID=2805397 RepID=UPI0030EDF3AA